MSDHDWLQNLKVGDTVIEDRLYDSKRISQVVRLTKTQIVVKPQPDGYETKYSRDSRDGWGRSVGGGTWDHYYLREATPEAVAAVKEAQYRRVFQNKLDHLSWNDVPLERIKQIRELIEPYVKRQEKK